MKRSELRALGIPEAVMGSALAAVSAAGPHLRGELLPSLRAVVGDPEAHLADPYLGALAQALVAHPDEPGFAERAEAAPWREWGDDLGADARTQMANAARLPVSVRGALMADAHPGYGLPIGGVLATDNAVIPYAVGVDIACRMRLTVVDTPVSDLTGAKERLAKAIERETRFGIGAQFEHPRDHEVLDADWGATDVTRRVRQKAARQLGTSGSGNHFVEFGTLTLEGPDLGLDAGVHVAILSHSGSRGAGAAVAEHYTKAAMAAHPELPRELAHLSWLDLDSDAGREYWEAMTLMGAYAAANHELIHRNLVRAIRAEALASVENHHNFAWKETHDGREVIVHRKGATPAGAGVLGVIPGSMATPGFLVRGLGNEASLRSASHGAGRVMSRGEARRTFRWAQVRPHLEDAGVTLLSAGIDESPGVYKPIDRVMAAQRDLVEVVARFDPRIVKMAEAGERPED